MNKISRKRILALILSAIFCLSSSFTVFAAAPEDATSTDNSVAFANEVADTYALGNCVGSNATVTSGYGCELVVTLNQSYFNPYFRAMADGNENNSVYCYVVFPDGSSHYLGIITADGSKTPYLPYTGTIPAGNYTFKFYGSDSGTTGFAGFIYSST